MHFSAFLISNDDTTSIKSHLINVLLLEEQSKTLFNASEEVWNIDLEFLRPMIRLCDMHWKE